MAKGNRSSKPFHSLFQGIDRLFRKGRQTIAHQLQGWVIKIKRRDRYNQAGFVLPTVTMVLLVVVLLTFAISFRAFERSQDARFARVSEAALNAATPALDRAKAKLEYALQELSNRGETLSDDNLYRLLTSREVVEEDADKPYFFQFGDEDVLEVSYDIDENGSIEPNGAAPDENGQLGDDEVLEDNESITTAWRFPVDTNNDGTNDSYTLYGIFFRRPIVEDGRVAKRTPLDARTLPMPPLGSATRDECRFADGTNESLVTPSGWIPTQGKLKKSFFVYAVTVPENGSPGGISALEYQQDWKQEFLNGVVYEGDLEIAPGPEANIIGSLATQGNLIVSHFGNGEGLTLYLNSSYNSCFADESQSKIQVAGNVINGMIGNDDEANRRDVIVHLYNGNNTPTTEDISTENQSINEGAYEGMFNDDAYRRRLSALVEAQMENAEGNDPIAVQEAVDRLVANDDTLVREEVRRDELRSYFISRLRKVPFEEVNTVGTNTTALVGFAGVVDSGETLRPQADWSDIPEAITLQEDQLAATDPEIQQELQREVELGDRVLVGNNQPALELNDEDIWVAAQLEEIGTWTNNDEDRTRVTRAEKLPDAGDTSRDGFWERIAAREPETPFDGVGGLRVVTGAGIYSDDPADTFLPRPQWIDPTGNLSPTYDDPATTGVAETYKIVWPDTMPMSDPGKPGLKGDLQMRATAVYHYAEDSFTPPDDLVQEPIACVSSYYDPSTTLTAQNDASLPLNNIAGGLSNNGIVYPYPGGRPTAATFNAANGLFTAPAPLAEQANMVFPDGRFANKPLRDALTKLADGGTLNLADQAAIDTTLCAFEIRDNPASFNAIIPHGVIREATLLDARQVKANEADDPDTPADETFTLSNLLTDIPNLGDNYDLPLGERQPLEVRVTQLDLDQLRNEPYSDDYLLPYSGVVYASRDDALPDLSDRTANAANDAVDEVTSEEVSPVDYQLDPTRRPNGIMLLNGASLGRNDNANAGSLEDILREKGLTLVSNLPVYIQAENSDVGIGFNLHTEYEFLEDGDDGIDVAFPGFYDDREELNPNFACRGNDTFTRPDNFACGNGDNWRPATVLADAITLLSEDFRLGYRNEGDFDLQNHAGGNNVAIGYAGGGASLNETQYGLDLNGDGDFANTAVPGTDVTVKAARQINGFNAYNNFVTNGLSSGAQFDIDGDGTPEPAYDDENYVDDAGDPPDSTYFNNFVTPIQRRGQFSEYVMEICRKLPVSTCEPADWEILVDANGNGTYEDATDTSIKSDTFAEYEQLTNGSIQKADLLAGTTAQAVSDEPQLQRFPRRVAFLRQDNYTLELDGTLPIPLGIDTGNVVECFSAAQGIFDLNSSGTPANSVNCSNNNTAPQQAANALWFQTRNGGNRNWGSNYPLWYYDPQNPTASKNNFNTTVQQPLLIPVLQIHTTDGAPGANTGTFPESPQNNGAATRWLPKAESDAEYNLVLGAGDVPGRPGELNGGLQNLPRFIENWQDNDTTINVLGSFIQSDRSRYATAPYLGIRDVVNVFTGNPSNRTTDYKMPNARRRTPYFLPPGRNLGFDVGLLYQQAPDFFTQSFAVLEKGNSGVPVPDEYFREVSRDDEWVKALLCSETLDGGNDAVPAAIRPNCEDYGS
jgi:hypothetical protein